MFRPPIETVLHLPAPPSVNRTRRIDWGSVAHHRDWQARADMAILAAGGMKHLARMSDKFEVIITLDADVRIDLDNSVKALVDYCRRLELIVDDDPRHFRKLTVQWGNAPSGCTLTLRSTP